MSLSASSLKVQAKQLLRGVENLSNIEGLVSKVGRLPHDGFLTRTTICAIVPFCMPG